MSNSAVKETEHLRCFACGRENSHGLHLQFLREADGSVTADFFCHEAFQGYEGALHGGIIATIMDSAMTNCLFQQGVKARTARLNIRYAAPVVIGSPGRVITTLERKIRHAYLVKAQLFQGDRLCAEARAVFIHAGDNGKQVLPAVVPERSPAS